MELIRDQGFREQRGEYGSRIGGDSLDVSVCVCFLFGFGERTSNSVLNLVFSHHLGSCPPICSRYRHRQKWRNDQENTE